MQHAAHSHAGHSSSSSGGSNVKAWQQTQQRRAWDDKVAHSHLRVVAVHPQAAGPALRQPLRVAQQRAVVVQALQGTVLRWVGGQAGGSYARAAGWRLCTEQTSMQSSIAAIDNRTCLGRKATSIKVLVSPACTAAPTQRLSPPPNRLPQTRLWRGGVCEPVPLPVVPNRAVQPGLSVEHSDTGLQRECAPSRDRRQGRNGCVGGAG